MVTVETANVTLGAPERAEEPPAGDYVMQVTMDQAQVEVPFSVAAGEEATVAPVLNAGIAALTATYGKYPENV